MLILTSLFKASKLTELDSWRCPECEDKESRKRQPKVKKKEVSTPISAKNKIPQIKKQNDAKKKTANQTEKNKTVPKKQMISKEYISSEETSESDTETRTDKVFKKKEDNSTKDRLEKVVEKAAKPETLRKSDETKKGQFTLSDSLSDSYDNDDASSGVGEDNSQIIRIPVDPSQLDDSYSSSD